MALRSTEAIKNEIMYSKGVEREFYQSALMLIQSFPEDFIKKQRQCVIDEISLLESKRSPDDMCKNNEKINAEIKRLKSKFKMFNYILV